MDEILVALNNESVLSTFFLNVPDGILRTGTNEIAVASVEDCEEHISNLPLNPLLRNGTVRRLLNRLIGRLTAYLPDSGLGIVRRNRYWIIRTDKASKVAKTITEAMQEAILMVPEMPCETCNGIADAPAVCPECEKS